MDFNKLFIWIYVKIINSYSKISIFTVIGALTLTIFYSFIKISFALLQSTLTSLSFIHSFLYKVSIYLSRSEDILKK
jgi:hypothetical protein